MQDMVVVGLIVEELLNANCVKYRSRYLPSQCGLVVVGLIFEEIPNINVKCGKVTGVQNIDQGHQVKVPAGSVHREEALYNAWWLKALQLRTYGMAT